MLLPNRSVGLWMACLVGIGMLLLGGCRQIPAQEGHEAPTVDGQRVVFHVEGMSCERCEKAVRTAIADLDGVIRVDTSLPSRRAFVEFDPARLRPETIAAKLSRLGYDPVCETPELRTASH
ncbi:MAG: heavy-metal-associated domain-containing protein [Acidobacteriota bacterium]|nr:MAG: heavy-metal-associated domain-containing protein [Acidobacteriota bacterium]